MKRNTIPLKNKMKFESVTGKASVYVYQDFWAQVLVYNMVQDIRNSADEAVVVTGREHGRKYPLHTNENMAIGLFKESMLKIGEQGHALTRKKAQESDPVLPIYAGDGT